MGIQAAKMEDLDFQGWLSRGRWVPCVFKSGTLSGEKNMWNQGDALDFQFDTRIGAFL